MNDSAKLTAPTNESIAMMLTGRPHPLKIPEDILAKARAAGKVIVYGHSDYMMKFAGMIDEKIGISGGGIAYLDRKGLFTCGDDIPDFVIRRRTKCSIEVLWCAEGDYSLTFATDLPHATFDIAGDRGPYCRGIVFALADLPEAQRAGEPS